MLGKDQAQQLTLYNAFKVPPKRARINSLPDDISTRDDTIEFSRSVPTSLPSGARKLKSSSEIIPKVGGNLPALPPAPPDNGKDIWEIVLHNPATRQVVLFNPTENKFAVSKEVPLGDEIPNNERCPLCKQPVMEHTELPTHDEPLTTRPSHSPTSSIDALRLYKPAEVFTHDQYFSLLNATLKRRSSRPTISSIAEGKGIFMMDEDLDVKGKEKIRNTDSKSKTGKGKPSSASTTKSYTLEKGSFNTGYYAKFFREQRRIGKGAYGSVYLCHHVLDGVDLGCYAVKQVVVGDNHPYLEAVLKEVKVLEQLHHPNCVSYKHSWLELTSPSDFGPQNVPTLFVLTNYANSGNLYEYIFERDKESEEKEKQDSLKHDRRAQLRRKLERERQAQAEDNREGKAVPLGRPLPTHIGKKHYLEDDVIWNFFVDILNGLSHLHHRGIIHCDLKPQNLLLHTVQDLVTQEQLTSILITDFGSVKSLILRNLDQSVPSRTGNTGTIAYNAPEVLTKSTIPSDDGTRIRYEYDFTTKSDVWSLGVILYEMCFSESPFTKMTFEELEEEIKGYYPPRECPYVPLPRSPIFIKLIQLMLQRDPGNRPTVDQILCMPDVLERNVDRRGALHHVVSNKSPIISTRPAAPTRCLPSPPSSPPNSAPIHSHSLPTKLNSISELRHKKIETPTLKSMPKKRSLEIVALNSSPPLIGYTVPHSNVPELIEESSIHSIPPPIPTHKSHKRKREAIASIISSDKEANSHPSGTPPPPSPSSISNAVLAAILLLKVVACIELAQPFSGWFVYTILASSLLTRVLDGDSNRNFTWALGVVQLFSAILWSCFHAGEADVNVEDVIRPEVTHTGSQRSSLWVVLAVGVCTAMELLWMHYHINAEAREEEKEPCEKKPKTEETDLQRKNK